MILALFFYPLPFFLLGHSSSEDRKVIEEFVKKNGANPEAWKALAKILNRSHPRLISYHYKHVMGFQNSFKHWTSSENEIFLSHFFAGTGHGSLQIVQQLRMKECLPLVRELNRYAKLTFGLTCTGSPLGSVIQSFLSSATFCPDTPIFSLENEDFFFQCKICTYTSLVGSFLEHL